jgi:hypothetical protein
MKTVKEDVSEPTEVGTLFEQSIEWAYSLQDVLAKYGDPFPVLAGCLCMLVMQYRGRGISEEHAARSIRRLVALYYQLPVRLEVVPSLEEKAKS